MALHISYESVGFPAGGPVANGGARLSVSWDKLLWAALTVGRPNRQYVFAHGMSSAYEALFRLSLVRMALEQAGPGSRVLRRTAVARSLDPTEKGAVNYFLGMAVAKLFADELLSVPWMVHLDVFRAQLSAVLNSRSRPDLIGQSIYGQWVALECKGRVSAPNREAKTKAKQQAQRVVSIGATAPAYAIGAITYFRNGSLRFFWEDPETDPKVAWPVEVDLVEGMWDEYYAPVLALMRRASMQTTAKAEIAWTSRRRGRRRRWHPRRGA